MSFDTAIVSSPKSDFVELAGTRQGKLYDKHILSVGTLHYKKNKFNITPEYLDKMVENFYSGVCPIVQIPLANDKNEHVEDPDRNLGEVIGLRREGNRLIATLDARVNADKFGKTYLGASAMFAMNYENTATGEDAGPTLLHVAVTNRPHQTGLDSFAEVIAASAEDIGEVVFFLSSDDSTEEVEIVEDSTLSELTNENEVTLTSDKDDPDMTYDELIAALKDEHGIDVPALQAEVSGNASLSNDIVSAFKEAGIVKLSADQESDTEAALEAIVGSVADIKTENVSLTNEIANLKSATSILLKERAANEVAKAVADGYIVPSKEAEYLELRLTNPDLYDKLLPEEPIVRLSVEDGFTPVDDAPQFDMDAELARLEAIANGGK